VHPHDQPDRDSEWFAPLAVLSAGAVFVELLAAVFVMVTITRGNPVGDWVSFYAAGTLIRDGHGAQLFDPASQAAAQEAIFRRDLVANGYPLPAFMAFVFAPFTLLSFAQSYWLWFAVNVCALGVVGVMARDELREADPGLRRLLLIAAALSMPMMYVLVLGQIDLIVAGSLFGSYALFKRGRRFSAGCVLGLAIAKPHLVAAAVLLLLVKREWRALAGFSAVAMPLLVAPVFVLGPPIIVDQIRLWISYPGSPTDYTEMMVNLGGTIASVAPSSPRWVWLAPQLLLGTVALGLGARVWKRNDAAAGQSWALAFLLPLLYSPHVHIQSMVLLLAAVVLYAAAQDRRKPVLRSEHVLSALVLIVAFWLLSVAGVSLLSVFSIFVFLVALRAWPVPSSAMVTGVKSDAEPRRRPGEARAA
jgi:hypothetical protein